MIQLAPQMRILVAIEPADFRKGIDGLARLARDELASDPFLTIPFPTALATPIRLLLLP